MCAKTAGEWWLSLSESLHRGDFSQAEDQWGKQGAHLSKNVSPLFSAIYSLNHVRSAAKISVLCGFLLL